MNLYRFHHFLVRAGSAAGALKHLQKRLCDDPTMDWLLPTWAGDSSYCLLSMDASDWLKAMEQCSVHIVSIEVGS